MKTGETKLIHLSPCLQIFIQSLFEESATGVELFPDCPEVQPGLISASETL